jgi:hypothetical protein
MIEYIICLKLIITIVSCASIASWNKTDLTWSKLKISSRIQSGSNSVTQTSTHHQYFFHKLPQLSHEMSLHTLEYKPRTFSITSRKLSEKKILVEFNYTNTDVYTKYSIRMRYHNHLDEYTTNKTLIDRYESNKIILHDFPSAQYILCVTLHPSMFVSNYQNPPISTSDMCIDILFGDDHGLSGHNKTGLLMPLLLAVVVVQIASLPILKKIRCNRLVKKIKGRRLMVEVVNGTNRRMSSTTSESETESSPKSSLDLKDMSLGHLLDLRKNEHELENVHDRRQLNVLLYYDDPDYDDSDKDEYYICSKVPSPNLSSQSDESLNNENNRQQRNNINFY